MQRNTNVSAWIEHLRSATLHPNQIWAPAESVSILLATRELQGWLADTRPYDGATQKWSWLSVIADFQQGVGQLGPRLRSVLDPELAVATAAVSSMKVDFESPGNKKTMPGLLQAHRGTVPKVLCQLSARWDEAAIRVAAWADLIAACRDTGVSYETLAVRRDLFWELVRASDHDTRQLGDYLAGVLGDYGFTVTLAKSWLGEIDAETPLPRALEAAGLTEGERLDLCERLLTQSPRSGHYVVWLAFDHVGPGFINRTLGPISFWGAEWLRAVLEQGGPNLAFVPDELKVTDSLFQPYDLPDDREMLMARVDLNTGAWTDPIRVASEQAEAVVTLAGFYVGDAKWQKLSGYLVVVDGRVRGIGSFQRAFGHEQQPNQLYQSAMEAELDALAPRLGTRLPITDNALSEVIGAVRWWQEARGQSSLAAVLLHVRVLELISQRVSPKKWYMYLDDHQRNWRVQCAIVDGLKQVIDECLHKYERIPDAADRQWLRELFLDINKRRSDSLRYGLEKGLAALPELARLFPSDDNLGRRVQDAVSRYTLEALPLWRDELERDWELALGRLVRVRNALAHGGPILDDTVATVHGFALQLAGRSLGVALEGLLKGDDVAEAHKTYKQNGDAWRDRLSAAESVLDALTGW